MLNLNNLPFVIPDFMSEEHREEIRQWGEFVYKEKSQVVFIQANRYRKNTISVPEVLFTYSQKVMDELVLYDYEPTLDMFINLHKDGQQVKPHIHNPKWCGWEGFIDLRCNILITKPKEGGMPILEDKRYEINAGDLIIFDGGKDHYTDVVKGENRFLISYGFYCLFDDDGNLKVPDRKLEPAFYSNYAAGAASSFDIGFA